MTASRRPRRDWRLALTVAGLLTAFGTPAAAASAYVRVVDVGNGLCVVIRTPDGHSLVYDAGDKGQLCVAAVREIIPESAIDLLVLSHSDADHIQDAARILQAKAVRTLVHTEDAHATTAAITRTRAAIATAEADGAKVWSLRARSLPVPDDAQSRTFALGQGKATLIAGWHDGAQTRGPGEGALPTSERNNALSLVVRFDYGGHSLLLTGDTIGRLRHHPNSMCGYSERLMVEAADAWPIDADVLVGQHHGGNNASSNCFIRAVSPTWVVFSAGHANHHHPTQAAADRFIANGVDPDRMLRTDRNDDEGPPEWVYGATRGCIDQPGEDDVEIHMPDDGSALAVAYRRPEATCLVRGPAFYVHAPRGEQR